MKKGELQSDPFFLFQAILGKAIQKNPQDQGHIPGTQGFKENTLFLGGTLWRIVSQPILTVRTGR